MSDTPELTGKVRAAFDWGFQMGAENAMRLHRMGHSDDEIKQELEIMLHYLRLPDLHPLDDVFYGEMRR